MALCAFSVWDANQRNAKRTVPGLSDMAVLNQGLIDRRERWAAVQALTFLRGRGVKLEPDGLMVEALRNGWGSTGQKICARPQLTSTRARSCNSPRASGRSG